jgi:DNA-binding winged helix-turn-helix (wHTH) protein
MEGIPQKKLFRFGVFEADQRTGELRKQGRRVLLPGQPFDVLIMLLEHPGEVVSRSQIRERLWPDGTFVDFDHSLNTAVNKIRDVLGDSASSPRFVETIARRGYRFIAPVQLDGGLATLHSAEPSPESSSSFLTAPHEVPHAQRNVVSIFFLLLQLMYLFFYIISLARLHAVQDAMAATLSHPLWATVVLIVTAVAGIPIRLYLISTVAFRVPGLREKFLRLFPFLFPLDEIWALAPFLLVPQIGYGLALGFTAILLYSPFSERSLILMGAGAATRVPSARS